MPSNRIPRATLLLPVVLALLPGLASPSLAASDYSRDVCASGCTYSSVQDAIDSITGSDADHVYTVYLGAGVLESDTSISTGGKSYLNFVGKGIDASILRATETWFNSQSFQSTAGFFDISGSSHVTLRGLTIDARSQKPASMTSEVAFITGVTTSNVDHILFDSVSVQGLSYGVWEPSPSSSGLVEINNSEIGAVRASLVAISGDWHIFSSLIKSVNDGSYHQGIGYTLGFQLGATVAGSPVRAIVWGSHIHAESADDADTVVEAVRLNMVGMDSSFFAVGSTLHVRDTSNSSSISRRMLAVADEGTTGKGGTISLIGTEIEYENLGVLGGGKIGGVGYVTTDPATQINLAGCQILDKGAASGSTALRGDIVWAYPACVNTSLQPNLRIANSRVASVGTTCPAYLRAGIGSEFDTLGAQKGTATFPGAGSTVAVTLPLPEPDAGYKVALSVNANETVWIVPGSKTATGFTLGTSKNNSQATVDWILAR